MNKIHDQELTTNLDDFYFLFSLKMQIKINKSIVFVNMISEIERIIIISINLLSWYFSICFNFQGIKSSFDDREYGESISSNSKFTLDI